MSINQTSDRNFRILKSSERGQTMTKVTSTSSYMVPKRNNKSASIIKRRAGQFGKLFAQKTSGNFLSHGFSNALNSKKPSIKSRNNLGDYSIKYNTLYTKESAPNNESMPPSEHPTRERLSRRLTKKIMRQLSRTSQGFNQLESKVHYKFMDLQD